VEDKDWGGKRAVDGECSCCTTTNSKSTSTVLLLLVPPQHGQMEVSDVALSSSSSLCWKVAELQHMTFI